MRTLKPVKNIDPPTEEEIAKAKAKWDKYAPPTLTGLLDASTLGDNQKTRFVWDAVRREYVNRATGRRVSKAELRAALMQYIKRAK